MNRLILNCSVVLLTLGVCFQTVRSQDEIVICTPFDSNKLAGTVVNQNEEPIIGVVVERMNEDWKEVIEITESDPSGYFQFTKRFEGTQYLRFRRSGFDSMLIRVRIVKEKTEVLVVKLNFAM